jgi:hypothetical protein
MMLSSGQGCKLRQNAWFKVAFHDSRIFGRIAGDATTP